jgi:hypothetical protein
MAKFITEALNEINTDPKKIELYKNDTALKFIFEYAYIKDLKMDLPDGEPPYRPDTAPIGMSPANLRMETKKFYVFKRKDLTSIKREQLFIGLLEAVNPDEAKVLIAVKDQKLNKLYPKITRKLLTDAGIIPKEEKA